MNTQPIPAVEHLRGLSQESPQVLSRQSSLVSRMAFPSGAISIAALSVGPSPMQFATNDIRTASAYQLERKFRRLADQWLKETEHLSSITKASMHPAYQRIIGMGHEAVPLLLRELQEEPEHWFWALNAITEQDPAQNDDTFDGAVTAWLKWGKENGYL